MTALLSLGVIVAVFIAWCVYDFVVSVVTLPGEYPASFYLRRWFRETPWRRAAGALVLAGGFLFLFLHLIVQVI